MSLAISCRSLNSLGDKPHAGGLSDGAAQLTWAHPPRPPLPRLPATRPHRREIRSPPPLLEDEELASGCRRFTPVVSTAIITPTTICLITNRQRLWWQQRPPAAAAPPTPGSRHHRSSACAVARRRSAVACDEASPGLRALREEGQAMEPARRLLLSDYDGAMESPLPSPPPPSSATPFRPGVAVVVGILTSVFSITFLLLLYAKHCKRSAAESSGPYGTAGGHGGSAGAVNSGDRRNSGVDRAVVESLPVFRFGALRGQKEGLECAVCLGRFEPTEALRLLPKCRHGFHVECVDTWLDAHSTCPLCRSRVDPEDVLLLPEPPKPSTTGPPDPPETKAAAAAAAITKDPSPAPPPAPAPTPVASGRRISGRHSTGSVRAPGRVGPASRRSADGGVAVGCFDVGACKVPRKDRVLLAEPAAVVAEPDPVAFDRRFGHRILVSTAGGCAGETAPAAHQRWSDLRPSDLMFVRAEFLVTEAPARYSCSAAVANSNASSRSAIGVRSLSELAAGVRRLPPIRAEGEPRVSAGGGARRWPGSSWWAPRGSGTGSGAPAPARNGPIA